MTPMISHEQAASALAWWLEAGWDTAIDPEARQFGVPRPVTSPQKPDDGHAITGAAHPEPAYTDLSGVQDLAALKAYISAYEGCPLKKTATSTVIADGLAGATLMVIGEAPGAEEDRQGLPFVGPAGQLLDQMLAAVGYSRTHTAPEKAAYITNIVFWRPLGNRDPNSAEIASCLPITMRHIELARPRAILALGNVAAKTLLATETGITRLRGNWGEISLNGIATPVLPTYHPAFLLRKPASKAQAWADMLALKTFLERAA